MCESTLPVVTGLLPRAVRLSLDPGQVQLLINELVTLLEARAGSLRQDHDQSGALSAAALGDTAEWLYEYRSMLDALTPLPGSREPAAITIVTASTVAADALIRACAVRAVHTLLDLVPARSGEIARLRDAGAAVSAWARTLADLRELDEHAPDTVLE
jgi:hypothetical protein